MINRAKLQHILEYAKQQRHIGLHCKVPPEDMVEIVEMAMLHGKADGALTNEGTIPATQIKSVADLYGISVPGGRTTTYSTDAAEASDCRVMGWSVQEYIKLERYQAAMLQGADTELQCKAAIHDALCGKYNVESLADFVDWQRNHIAELEAAPPAPVGEGETAVMPDYPGYTMTQRECFQAGKKAGLAEAGNSPVIPDWQNQAEKMAEIYGISFVLFRNGESPQCADPTKVIISFTDEGFGHGSAAPQQEVPQALAKGMERYGDAMQELAKREVK